MTPAEFADALRQFCLMLGGSVTSYGRTTKRNAAVGGVPNSAHRFWLGADVVYDATVAAATAVETGQRLGLRVIRENDHDHLQPLGWAAG